ncbi:MBL fold metallo-hydrolase [Halarcobacter anaerophilus]|uniref:MBL fold metallo-hydrolase n=1 Tax=Halarcobacter anaerophilus TaxID=877500 RepID=UPI001161DB3C|nr:MBL fold metallo-hydrolase [Halarcobacter anaerophilus]QDF28897.1 5-phospho-alpha-D-ribosyl 1,2-cyclic phosphate phosphodiesterase [Halarcobacter anaerophilus]
MKLKFLGSADSAGIPVHNCNCIVCEKYREEKRVNLSTCAYLELNKKVILLDAGIDSISNIFDKKRISAVFLTHFHADHCMGLLRLRYSKDRINCYHPKDEYGFSDLFKHKHSIVYTPLEDFQEIIIEGISFTALPLKHSKNCYGYFIKSKTVQLAYLTDCFEIPQKTLEFLSSKKLDAVFIDACYDESIKKGNHLNYLQATKILDKFDAKQKYLMHTSHTTKEYIEKNKISLKYRYIKGNESFLF